jgi:hypothetical protein
MRKLSILLSFITLLSTTLFAQSISDEIKSVMEGYNNLQKLTDENERNYQLNILANRWLNALQVDSFRYPTDNNNQLKQIVSADKQFTVYYFVPKTSKEPDKIELFITHPDTIKPNAFYFSEPLKFESNSKKEVEIKSLHLNIEIKKVGGLDYYELQLLEKNQIVVFKYHDICLKYLFEQMALSGDDDFKAKLNLSIENRLNNYLAVKENFSDSFDGIKRLSTLISDDKNLKICTWNIEKNGGENIYFGTVLTRISDGTIKLQTLTDATENIKSPEKNLLTSKKWYGAIYFDIVETEYKKQKFYTLLGFKADDEFTKTKLLDVLTYDAYGTLKFGSNIFNKNPGYLNRMIYQYSAGTNMMLKYDEERKMIVMDNLAPSNPEFKNNFRFYGPDFSYNGYKFEKGKWMLYLDLDLRNPKQK